MSRRASGRRGKARRLVLHCARGPVGVFTGRGYPAAPGPAGYAPFRGPGHAWLAGVLRQGKSAACWFVRRGRRVACEIRGETLHPGPAGRSSHWTLDIARLQD